MKYYEKGGTIKRPFMTRAGTWVACSFSSYAEFMGRIRAWQIGEKILLTKAGETRIRRHGYEYYLNFYRYADRMGRNWDKLRDDSTEIADIMSRQIKFKDGSNQVFAGKVAIYDMYGVYLIAHCLGGWVQFYTALDVDGLAEFSV